MHTTYIIQKFVLSAPDLPRAHWRDVCATRDVEEARAIVKSLAKDPTCKRGRALVRGVEIDLSKRGK